jgi:hypothetical protein
MRWLGVVTALSIGCASAPAVHVELPTRCACPRSPALAGAPTAKTLTPTDWQLEADRALNAEIAGATTVNAIKAETPAVARRRAPELLPAAFLAAAHTCADAAIDRERGRWLAIFKAKP